jgi:hypothetical protein
MPRHPSLAQGRLTAGRCTKKRTPFPRPAHLRSMPMKSRSVKTSSFSILTTTRTTISTSSLIPGTRRRHRNRGLNISA